MISFSIVVTAYENDAYLADCLMSVRSQTYPHWECIVVDDASPDRTSQIVTQFAMEDDRFRLLRLDENQGRHLARKAGASYCKNDYILFLDADDELAPTALSGFNDVLREHAADMLHFGIDVVAWGVSDETRVSFESMVNGSQGYESRRELCEAMFTPEGGYALDWRVTQRVFKAPFAKDAFKNMTDARLDRAEDCYEMFVLSMRASGEACDNSNRALRYFYGRGITGESALDIATFRSSVDQFDRCMASLGAYASESDDAFADRCVRGAKCKLLDLLMNDWSKRVPRGVKVDAIRYVASVFGDGVAAAQLMRIARDGAYAAWANETPIDGSHDCIAWFKLAERFASLTTVLPDEYPEFRMEARDHIANLEARSPWCPDDGRSTPSIVKRSSYEAQDIKIFVTTHKDVDLFYSDMLQPVQVGPVSGRKRLLWAYQDDEGDNIAKLNPMYCELTTQYWAWKNQDAKYYGFCHYRRYFDFSDVEHEENAYGEVMYDRVCWDAQKEFNLDDKSIRAAIEGFDVVTTGYKDLREFPERYLNPRDHYARAPYLHLEDFDRIIRILKDEHPDYAEDADAFLDGHFACFCNMFIMRKELFFKYCEWLFPLLDLFMEGWDTSRLSHQSLRTPGHLSERLFNIFMLHEKRVNPELRTKELQCVHFEEPEHNIPTLIRPIVGDGRPVIPVVLAADDGYVPMVTTTVYSMIKNASTDFCYDVVILEKDITENNKNLMRDFFKKFSHLDIRFINVGSLIGSYDLSTSNAHISIETYYRFLIQEVLPFYDKVLYLDSDLIVCGDVSELFSTDMGSNLVGAVTDIDYLGNLDMNGGDRMRYSKDVLAMADPFGYFQAGVLLMNIKELRQLFSFDRWLEVASNPQYIYDDQDILNSYCQGRVTYLDFSWNVMVDCGGRIAKVFTFAPASVYDAYMESYRHPNIIHYAGFEKPWKPGPCDMSEQYWSFARKTPYYERLLACKFPDRYELDGASCRARDEAIHELTYHEPVISPGNPLRRIFDGILPFGSRRREFSKSVVRKLRGKR